MIKTIHIIDDLSLIGRSEYIKPISYDYYFGGGMEVYCFERLRDTAERFCRSFDNEGAFSSEACEWLDDALAPYLSEWRYSKAKKQAHRWYWMYRLKHGEQPDRSKQLPTTVKWERGYSKRYLNMTTMDINLLERQERAMYFTLLDGRIVSYAVENIFSSENFREITTETAPKFRGCGYAGSNAAALAYDILQRGFEAVYNCACTNIASRCVAEGVGFRAVGKRFTYLASRDA